jgi:lipid-binding SYLF domain-containing protein
MNRRVFTRVTAAALALSLALPGPVAAGNAELEAEADAALASLKETEPVSDTLAKSAKGVLIFPEIIKGGFIVGAAGGKGVLRVGGKTEGYYQSLAASYGLQAGIEKFGYVMFLMDEDSLDYIRKTDGWEVGVGPTVTVADEGFAKKLSTTTAQSGVYVFFVGQQGFFAGLGIEGTKISRIDG